MNEILTYCLAVLVGISLALIGGGGSILTIPILVYVMGIHPLLATSYSLFIVGATSFAGAYNNFKKGYVKIRVVLVFGASSITTVFLTRKFLVPLIPKTIFRLGDFILTASGLTMLLFAVLMLAASISMIKDGEKNIAEERPTKKNNVYRLLIYGIVIGLTTGLLGAGGGFLLIPALVLIIGLPMKEAIGTSLLIISLNSLVGFTGDIGHFDIDWWFLVKVTLAALGGILAGSYLATKIDGAKLKIAFGWFVLAMAFFIIIKELSSAG